MRRKAVTKDNEPETLEELCDMISDNVDGIYIREQIGGKWGPYSLAEMPSGLAIKHALRFVKEGRVPVILKQEKGNA